MERFSPNPVRLAMACGAGAVLMGLVYLAMAGAPASYLAVNAGTMAAGAAAVLALGDRPAPGPTWIVAILGAAILATALFGVRLDGVSRWVRLGPLTLQPGLILLPAMVLLFTRRGGAMAGALGALTVFRRDRWTLAAFAAAVAAFAVTLFRADPLPAQPFVEGVLAGAFEVGPLAGLAAWLGASLLLVPAGAGLRRDPEHRAVYATFGAVWLAILAAALLGNYPTPLVGYGASSVLGYVLSAATLPTRRRP